MLHVMVSPDYGEVTQGWTRIYKIPNWRNLSDHMAKIAGDAAFLASQIEYDEYDEEEEDEDREQSIITPSNKLKYS